MFRGNKENKKNPQVLEIAVLLAIVMACLAPFLDKAFNVDDPLFLWTARHILSAKGPLDFYGFKVNWYGMRQPMWVVQENPPLAAYYIALAASGLGWAEPALHAAFLVPAAAAAVGTYFLACELCSMPLAATLAGLLTPVFLVSGATLMCDVMMVAWWVWAVFLWVKGTRKNSVSLMLLASFCVALAGLSKYFGMSLIPLLLVYSLAGKEGRRRIWLLFIPIAVLAGYDWWTYEMYGRGLLLGAGRFALSNNRTGEGLPYLLSMLTFAGGCFATVLFYAPALWRRRVLLAWAAALAAMAALAPLKSMFTSLPLPAMLRGNAAFYWMFIVQLYLFAFSGTAILALVFSDLARSRDAESLLLFLWVMGTLVFAGFLNWVINARILLPIFPALGILIMRGIGRGKALKSRWPVLLPLVPSLIISFWAARADYTWANTQRSEAVALSRQYTGNKDSVYFLGHWGFQYYMQRFGFRPLDTATSILVPGDTVIIPLNNASDLDASLPDALAWDSQMTEVRIPSSSWLATMSRPMGASFYAVTNPAYPFPFMIGPVPPEIYFILKITGPFHTGGT